jgi:uncharacterized protein (TIGR03067 family)
MRWCSLLILLAPLAASGGAPSQDDVKKELQQFQGSWQAVALWHADGQQASEDEVQNTQLVVEGNRFTLTGKEFTISGTFTLDPTKAPRTIDVLIRSDDGRESQFLGANRQRIVRSGGCFFRHRITALNVCEHRQRPRG